MNITPAFKAETIGLITRRLIPFLMLLYLIAYLDRSNISVAALQMNADLGLTSQMYGLGAGLFYVTYIIFEVPSNIVLARVGARRWIARIMVTWGLIACGMAFIQTAHQREVLGQFRRKADIKQGFHHSVPPGLCRAFLFRHLVQLPPCQGVLHNLQNDGMHPPPLVAAQAIAPVVQRPKRAVFQVDPDGLIQMQHPRQLQIGIGQGADRRA